MSPPVGPVRERVREFVLRGLQAQGLGSIGDEDSLQEAGYLDSLSIFQLIAFVEDEFGVRVPDDEITFDNFGSIDAIDRFVSARPTPRSARP